jgi:hypothetical protein
MEDQDLLSVLQSAYDRGVTLEQIQQALNDDPNVEQGALQVAEDFFLKKKDSSEGSQAGDLVVSESESVQDTMASPSTAVDSNSGFLLQEGLTSLSDAYDRGVNLSQIEQEFQDNPEFVSLAKDYYKTLESRVWDDPREEGMGIIIDDNPNMLGRLWNRGAASGRLAAEIAKGEATGYMNWENIAYLNSIMQRDGVKKTGEENPVFDFAADVVRAIPESLISMATSIEAGLTGAAAGAGTGAGIGSVVPGIGTAVGAGTGAVSGFFGASSLAIEYAHSLMDVIREEGVNVTDGDQLAFAFEDEELMDRAREKGLKRGIPIAIFDAISGGIGGKVGTTVVKNVSKSATNRAAKILAAETLTQGALGAGGELSGQLVAGEKIRPRDIALEAFAELGPAAPVMAYNLAGRINKTPGELKYVDNIKSKENQSDVVEASNAVDAIPEMSKLNTEIEELEAVTPVDKNEARVKKQKLRELKDKKYDLKADLSENYLALDEETRKEVKAKLAMIMVNDQTISAQGSNPELSNVLREENKKLKAEIKETITGKTTSNDQASGQEVQGDIEARQELGDVPDTEGSAAPVTVSGILQAREEEGQAQGELIEGEATERSSSFLNIKDREGQSLNLYDPNDAAALRRALDEGEFRAGEREYLENMILASESYRKSIPEAKMFVIGFGREGYQNALERTGFGRDKPGQRSAGMTARDRGQKNVGRIALEVPVESSLYGEAQGRGPGEKFTGIQTAYHEIFHNVLNQHFGENLSDYNQLRKLVIRQLSESDVKQLNDFAKRYADADDVTGTLPSEEFMVQLSGLLANKNIKFDPSFLEQLKAFIGKIIQKVTGGRVNFQELNDAVLAQDLANYLKGMTEAMRLGADVREVSQPASLRTERFQRTRQDVRFGPDGEVVSLTEARNAASLPDPENYDRTLDPAEKLLKSIKDKTRSITRGLEKKLNTGLRKVRGEVLSAMEFKQSANIPYLKNLANRLKSIRKITDKMTPEQRDEVYEASDAFLFGEDQKTRDEGIARLKEINETLAQEVSIMKQIRDFYQGQFESDPMFDILPNELIDIIKDNSQFYGTTTYRAFTDPDFTFDSELGKAAEQVMVLEALEEVFLDLTDQLTLAPEGMKVLAEMREMKLDPRKPDDVKKYVEAKKKSLNKGIKDLSKEGNTSAVVTATENLKAFSEKDLNTIQEEIDAAFLAEKIQAENLRWDTDEGLFAYIDKVEAPAIQAQVRKYIKDIQITSRQNINNADNGFVKDTSLGGLRVPTRSFKGKQDLPVELRTFLGEERNPFIKFTTTVNNLANIYGQYGLVSRVNKAGQNAGTGDIIVTKAIANAIMNGIYLLDAKGDTLPVYMNDINEVSARAQKELIYLAEGLGLKRRDESLTDFYDRIGIEYKEKDYQTKAMFVEGKADKVIEPTNFNEFQKLSDAVEIYFRENYTSVQDNNSPLKGQSINNDFVEALKMTPLYAAKNQGMRIYYGILLQMRRTRVLYNLPTWRKNIMGGWYFLAANGILPIGENLGGYNVIKDLRTRLKKMKDGEYTDPQIQEYFETAAKYGLLGSSINLAMFDNINDSFYAQMSGENPNKAWGWMKQKSKDLAYQYGAIDDYTKLVGFLAKRENFAKRLASNPEGKPFSELNPQEQNEVNEMTAERIKQNFPTMSRIHPAFRGVMQSPFGDFLSFRLESFRSFLSVYQNAVSDIREGATNESLTPSQKKAYILDGTKALVTGSAMAGMSAVGYTMMGELVRSLTGKEDEDEQELAATARGVNMILPPWMQGANIVPIEMNKNGEIRFVNMSSEDPYDEIQGLIYGRDGINRLTQINEILSDFKDPNMAVKLVFNLAKGENQYGQPIRNSDDLNWFYRHLIPSSYLDWDKTTGTYVLKEVFIPPNIAFIERTLRKRAKEIQEAEKEGRDPELEPLNALQLGTNIFFRDYPVNIASQFGWNLKDKNFREKWEDLPESRRTVRKAHLDEVKQAYQYGVTYGEAKDNYDLIDKFENQVRRKFGRSPEELDYILYDMELPD